MPPAQLSVYPFCILLCSCCLGAIIRAASFLSVQFGDTFSFFPQMAAFFRRTVTIMGGLSRSEIMTCWQALEEVCPVRGCFLFMNDVRGYCRCHFLVVFSLV